MDATRIYEKEKIQIKINYIYKIKIMKQQDRKIYNSFKKATSKLIQEIYKDTIIVNVTIDIAFGIDCSYLYSNSVIYFIAFNGDETIYKNKNNFLNDLLNIYNISLSF